MERVSNPNHLVEECDLLSLAMVARSEARWALSIKKAIVNIVEDINPAWPHRYDTAIIPRVLGTLSI